MRRIRTIPQWKVLPWIQKGVRMDTVGSRELEEECVVIIVTNSATPKTSAGFCTENLPIGGLDRVMEGAFKLQQMQEQPLKGKNPQPLKYHLAKEQMGMPYKLLNQSQQPNTNVRSCNLAQTSNLLAALSVTKKFKSTLDHRFRCFGKEMLGYLRTKLGIQRTFGTPFISLLLFRLFVPRFLRAFPLTYYNQIGQQCVVPLGRYSQGCLCVVDKIGRAHV